MKETQLVRLCTNYLIIKGHFVWRNNSGVTKNQYTNKFGQTSERMWRAGVRGGSDIIGISKDGMFIAIECKVGKNKPTEMQKEFLQEITNRGGIAAVVYSLEDLQATTNL